MELPLRRSRLDSTLTQLEKLLADTASPDAQRVLSDAAALRFHLHAKPAHPIVAILGGTGTGKSTLVNRLVGADVTATSLLRTYTAGAIAIVNDPATLPPTWLRLQTFSGPPPARGDRDILTLITAQSPLLENLTLIDTPDLDGDLPEHHAQADRVFRWAQSLVFVVTPEKYQMTELLPYYRLAKRYDLPARFIMNKCEEQAVVDDFHQQLASRDWPDAQLFVVPRDDAGYQPPPGASLDDLRSALSSSESTTSDQGLANRSADLAQRLIDRIVAPGREQRRAAERAIESLRAMERPAAGVDVNPVTLSLQRRLQQRSVLYLIGPQRLLDRVRQMPILVARLPRTLWDVLRGEPAPLPDPTAPANSDAREVPDFAATLEDQFRILQTRIEDVVRSSGSITELWLDANRPSWDQSKLNLTEAKEIADEELADLKKWLEKRWEKDPRDTRLIMTLLKHLPGGSHLTKWSEAAPYLLAIIVATHGAFFGHLDLMILGGYSLMTWLTERLSNEVASRTRLTNKKIEDRYARLAHTQIQRTCTWLSHHAPSPKLLTDLEQLATSL